MASNMKMMMRQPATAKMVSMCSFNLFIGFLFEVNGFVTVDGDGFNGNMVESFLENLFDEV